MYPPLVQETSSSQDTIYCDKILLLNKPRYYLLGQETRRAKILLLVQDTSFKKGQDTTSKVKILLLIMRPDWCAGTRAKIDSQPSETIDD